MEQQVLDQDYIQALSNITIESDTDAIFWLDYEGIIYRVNKAACDILHYDAEELVGKKIQELIRINSEQYSVNKSHYLKHLNQLKQDGHFVKEQEYHSKDGHKLIFEVSSQSIFFQNREFACIFARDITERKKAQHALQNALIELETLKNQLHAENVYLQNEIKLTYNFEEIIGRSRALHEVLRKVEQVAETDSSVMLLGETGTGKELIARAIHSISSRSSRPLVKVNCAALPVSLIESELFGHEKGAFTGALYRKIGRFELASGGTIFLDEIGDLPMEIQVKLLRILQDGEFERLGSTRTLKTDVRLITATNRDLDTTIREGKFRDDLFYRLNVFPIELPPLRDRRDDIPLLVKYFVDKFSVKIGRKITRIPVKAMNSLKNYNWPGNIRELENIIERAVIISNQDELHLGNWLNVAPQEINIQKISSLEEIERDYILKILNLTNWKVSGAGGAAMLLKINPQTLTSRMRKLGINRK